MKTTIPFITIVTPVYNREKELQRLYESLCQQTCKEFVWLVADDGSAASPVPSGGRDARCPIRVEEWSQNGFETLYLWKPNGGKHTALNIAFGLVETELLFIVDSDDVLTPDAVATIKTDWNSLRNAECGTINAEVGRREGTSRKLCGLGYLRGYSATERIGDAYTQDRFVSDFITERYNRGVNGDKAEVWVTKCLRGFRYPEYPGERFISESVAWIWLAERYDMAFINKIIYITEYLEGGLSDAGRALRFRSPKNMGYGSLITMSCRFSWKIRIKETLLYIVYRCFDTHPDEDDERLRSLQRQYRWLTVPLWPAGWLLYRYWKKKYKLS